MLFRSAEAKVPQSYIRTVTDAGGDQLQFISTARKDGTASSYVLHRVKQADGKFKNTRGASNQHPNLDSAKKAILAAVKAAAKDGWLERKAGGGGFVAKPDAFTLDKLPKPKGK